MTQYSTGAKGQNDYKNVQAVLAQRCTMCHGEQVQMKNVRLDSPANVKTHALNIYQQVVVTKLMPMNNATNITDAERLLVSIGLRLVPGPTDIRSRTYAGRSAMVPSPPRASIPFFSRIPGPRPAYP